MVLIPCPECWLLFWEDKKMFQEFKFGLPWELLDYTSILPTFSI